MITDSGQLYALIMLNTIGIAILRETFEDAAYYLTHSSGTRMKKLCQASQSFAFIRGTGLELICSYYHLDYNTEELRNSFFSMVGHREYVE